MLPSNGVTEETRSRIRPRSHAPSLGAATTPNIGAEALCSRLVLILCILHAHSLLVHCSLFTVYGFDTSDHYGSRNLNAQCFVDEIEYDGDRTDNPIFEGGGFIGTMTLAQCKSECTSRTDSKGRPCVAIEWSDGGSTQSDSTTKSCGITPPLFI